MNAQAIADAVRDVLHAGPADRPWIDRPDECERCGVADPEALVEMVHTVHRGVIRAHHECGDAAGYAAPEVRR